MMISGELSSLIEFRDSHLPKLRTFLEDEEVTRDISTLRGNQADRFLAWIKRDDSHASAHVFAIIPSGGSEDDIVGISVLRFVDSSHKSAVSGTIIGKPEHWGSGLAFESAVLKLDFAFKTLGLERVYASGVETNARAQNLVARLGYQKLSTRPEGIKDNGHPNRSFYELSRDQWLKMHP